MFSKIIIFGAVLALSHAGLLGQHGYNRNPLAAGAVHGGAALGPANAANLGAWTPGANLINGTPLAGANLWNPAQNPALAGPLGYSSPLARAGALGNGWPSPNLTPGSPLAPGSPLSPASPFGYGLPLSRVSLNSHSVPLGYNSPLVHGSPLAGASPLGYASPLTRGSPLAHGSLLAHGSPVAHGSPQVHGSQQAPGSLLTPGSPLARGPLAGASPFGYAGQPQISSIAYTVYHQRPAPYSGPLASVGPHGAPGALGVAGHPAHAPAFNPALGVATPLTHGSAFGVAGPLAHGAGPLTHAGALGAVAPLAHRGAFGPAVHAHPGALGAAALAHPGVHGPASLAHAGALRAGGPHGNIASLAQAALAQGTYANGYASAENYNSYPKYQFSYSVEDNLTGDHKAQREERDGDVVKGEYSLLQPDGSISKVSYAADDRSGFNAVVKNNGPNLAHTSRAHH